MFLVALPAMFLIGLLLHGRIFPFTCPSRLLVSRRSRIGLGAPWFIARMFEAGGGLVTAVTYEYGNCFLIVAGLLNFLVIIDAFDIGMGRK